MSICFIYILLHLFDSSKFFRVLDFGLLNIKKQNNTTNCCDAALHKQRKIAFFLQAPLVVLGFVVQNAESNFKHYLSVFREQLTYEPKQKYET